MKPTSRRVVLVLGVLVLGVLIAGLTSWESFVERYHLYRLRSQPLYLLQLLKAERNPRQDIAVRTFLKAGTGQQRLFSYCVEGTLTPPRPEFVNQVLVEYFGTDTGQRELRQAYIEGALLSADKHAYYASVPRDMRRSWDEIRFGLDLTTERVDRVDYELGNYNWHVTAGRGSGGGMGTIQEDGNPRLLSIIDLLTNLRPGKFRLTGYPHLECEIGRMGERHVWCEILPR